MKLRITALAMSTVFLAALFSALIYQYRQENRELSNQLIQSHNLMVEVREGSLAIGEKLSRLEQEMKTLQSESFHGEIGVAVEKDSLASSRPEIGNTEKKPFAMDKSAINPLSTADMNDEIIDEAQDEQARYESDQRIAAFRDDASNQFLSDERNDLWAREHEDIFSEDMTGVDGNEINGVNLESVECRSHTCKVIISLEDNAMPGAEMMFFSRVSESLPNAVWDVPQGNTITVYLSSREG